jgi:uncharacterized protein (TIGR00266 family)
MEYSIDHKPSYSLLDLRMDAGDTIVSESGAMAWMEGPLEVKTSTRGGVLAGLKRKLLSGESFFQNTYTATGPGARLALAPGAAGDVVAYELDGELLLEKGAYLASDPSVTVNAKFDGLRGFLNEGLFVLRCSGRGTLFFTAYGDIQEVEIDGEYVVDNGYAVAWEPSLNYRLTRARRIRSFLFGDQVLLRFSGRGKVWIQSRSPRSLANWVHPFRRVQNNNN